MKDLALRVGDGLGSWAGRASRLPSMLPDLPTLGFVALTALASLARVFDSLYCPARAAKNRVNGWNRTPVSADLSVGTMCTTCHP